MHESSDTELVKRFQKGDGAAFAEFSERHRERLYRMARAWLGDAMLAQDAVQEAFVRSYTGLGRFRFRAAPSTWLIRVCRNVCMELQRQHANIMEPSADELWVAGDSQPTDVPEYLSRALAQLPPRQRDVAILRLLEELSVRDTARILGCREGTVKAHLAKATANLRALLGEQNVESE